MCQVTSATKLGRIDELRQQKIKWADLGKGPSPRGWDSEWANNICEMG